MLCSSIKIRMVRTFPNSSSTQYFTFWPCCKDPAAMVELANCCADPFPENAAFYNIADVWLPPISVI